MAWYIVGTSARLRTDSLTGCADALPGLTTPGYSDTVKGRKRLGWRSVGRSERDRR
jgi:hypothetical protein